MKKRLLFLLLAALLIQSGCASPTDDPLPTLAQLPSLTPSQTHTVTPAFSATPTASATPSATRTLPPSATPTLTLSPTASLTVTPSLTITNTASPTATASPTQTTQYIGLGMLAQTALAATIAPTSVLPSPTFFTTPPGGAGTPLPPVIATPTLLPPPVTCPASLPPTLAQMLAADPALNSALGCPVGLTTFLSSAAQGFENGLMVYISFPPGTIFSLTSDGRFRRFPDTWLQGVDPDSGGEIPPVGFVEPIRGFGKVWRSNLDVRAALGWAIGVEQGGQATVQAFERGRVVYLPQRGETLVLIDNPDGQSGTWRAFSGGY